MGIILHPTNNNNILIALDNFPTFTFSFRVSMPAFVNDHTSRDESKAKLQLHGFSQQHLCEGTPLSFPWTDVLTPAMFRPPRWMLSGCRPMCWWSTSMWGRGQTPPRRLPPSTRSSAWTEQTTQRIPWAKVTNRGDIVRWNDNQVLPSDASSCAIKKKLKLNNYQHVPTVLDICDNSRKFSPSRYKKYITLILLYLPLSINTFLYVDCRCIVPSFI